MANTESLPALKAIIFDIGGVVLRSPFIGIAAYERDHGLPPNYINCSIVGRGSHGAWQRFERGEISLFPFYEQFGKDLSDVVSGNEWYKGYCRRNKITCPLLPESLHVDGRELFGRMMRESGVFDPHILLAIQNLRAVQKYRIIALTNNFTRTDSSGDPIPPSELAFLGWDRGGAAPNKLRALFDDFIDSSVHGMRKPDPDFYLLACKRNNIKPEEAVFLDDIGMNLKAAQKLGMRTIQVRIGETLDAVKQLEQIVGFNLTTSVKL
ncbi:hypothetical protein PC9H_001361 [Pleurotus ostreatus]|uniref:Epoxide hydrolase n=2 Tax=Pleurotus ostreatus TaxID=5322 RepID=A0A067P0J6_PLEO1|nr:uncharacterized protein PC9H_001361 [Pleurotus ostreatus]KAF7441012.1 hypothetical protein PC9H_001361 [Pleurotus ostreatus]KAJ8699521.1 hypothetical protein PTI98_002630 [Pleurotus ostreatus]KDQ33818.1 hypothetical protein PLEOSDRAFT_48053 [Pleurotus ostreatus PC15]